MFYLDLFRSLQEAGVRYVVVGGLALNLHGVERSTMDIDLAIALDDDNLHRAARALQDLQLQPSLPVSWPEVLVPGQLARWHAEKNMLALGLRKTDAFAPGVDLLTHTAVPFDALFERRVLRQVGDLTVPLASVDDLIALKRAAGRKIDQSDIEALLALKRLNEKS